MLVSGALILFLAPRGTSDCWLALLEAEAHVFLFCLASRTGSMLEARRGWRLTT